MEEQSETRIYNMHMNILYVSLDYAIWILSSVIDLLMDIFEYVYFRCIIAKPDKIKCLWVYGTGQGLA